MLFYNDVTVAVLDTGIYPHRDFGDRIIAFYDCVNGRTKMYDDNSHGTHVAGIIAGDGSASNGMYCGICPEARIAALKVLGAKGEGSTYDVLEGIGWVIENRNRYGIKVLNLSFGTGKAAANVDNVRLLRAVDAAWDMGLVVVTAAGNNGPRQGSITVPGTSCKVITVGTYDDELFRDFKGKIYRNYSGRGPIRNCDMKPEIVTKGNAIVSCTNQRNSYAVKSGTSMSAPIVSGAIAKLLMLHPEMTPDEVKGRLYERAVRMNLPLEQQGWGKLDIGKFLQD